MTFTEAFQSALRTQGDLSDDEIKRAEFVARSVAVAMLEEVAKGADQECRDCFALHDPDGLAVGERIAKNVRALMQQTQEA